MTVSEGVKVEEVAPVERGRLESILEESFDGLYLWHSKRILHEINTVRAAMASGAPVGLIMLKTLEPGVGYVFYVAVARASRGRGIGKLLLDDALVLFKRSGVRQVFASIEEDNTASGKLFTAAGFARTNLVEVSRTYGAMHAMNMYRVMVVVPGEVLLQKALD